MTDIDGRANIFPVVGLGAGLVVAFDINTGLWSDGSPVESGLVECETREGVLATGLVVG